MAEPEEFIHGFCMKFARSVPPARSEGFVSITIRTSIGAAAVLLFCLAAPRPVAASTIIDFSSAAFNGAIGQPSFSAAGVTVSVVGSGVLSKDNHAGLGVDNGDPDDRERDEINNFEILEISFPSGTTIDQITVSKLFHEGPPGDPDPTHAFNEIGFYQIDGNPAQMFTAPDTNVLGVDPFGDLLIDVPPALVTNLFFLYPVPDAHDVSNDFAVRNVRVSGGQFDVPVPEPTTLLLLGTGLVVLARAQRRRRQ